MLARGLRPLSRLPARRTPRVAGRRKYNANDPRSLPTYFQPPPPPPPPPRSPRTIFRGVLLGSTCLAGGWYLHSWLTGVALFGPEGLLDGEMVVEGVEVDMATVVQVAQASGALPMNLEKCQQVLELNSGFSVTQTTVGHTCQMPSNLPCEDTWSSGTFGFFNDPARDWCEWAIFDGHAGPRTSALLKQALPLAVGDALAEADCMDRPYTAHDSRIIDVIKQVFVAIDEEIINASREAIETRKAGQGRAHTIGLAAAAHAGSCALLALYDPRRSVLRVANTGDSRAVLGRWDKEEGKYVAQPMSVDQTGFNQDEVDRIQKEHPDEDTIDPKTGRIFGLAVTRAFGDARWKWPEEITRRAHEFFCGPAPRPNGVIKTPAYLTAEPEVTETKVRTGARPDFLILASDGLWDHMSSEDAVACVELWLDKNKPTHFLEKLNGNASSPRRGVKESPLSVTTFSSVSDLSGEDDDTWYDPEEKCLKWKVSPKHFINEDLHCGMHLVKNALGGRRRDLFTGVMSVQHPLARNVRDDITVHVVFFGVDNQEAIKT
ncbi:putative arabinogalactan endo-beta-1,4-galactanase A [Teratosphaeria destructans]|uniref:Arabinogalactan endo-beta-1,4-galactanase A n=1 Tax=Teratosphaeria destructans TaxID=418781 RepID=A0A9W7SPI8_9PEZI|nr:putative arabinogalactan endo-beta-1,4-galactanase A [Teratosphaeria destructans]